MTDEEKGHWIIFDACAAGVVVNPLNSHYENAVRHLEEIFRTKPPLNHDLLGAPHSCAEAIENMFGRITRGGGAHKRQGWAIAELKHLGVRVGAKAEELLSSLRRNSSTNSIKRLNNDAAVKARVWLQQFGERGVVPATVLSGVYKLRNLQDAQHMGPALFWAHDLKAMVQWIKRTKRR